jgi:hypothetical protein
MIKQNLIEERFDTMNFYNRLSLKIQVFLLNCLSFVYKSLF